MTTRRNSLTAVRKLILCTVFGICVPAFGCTGPATTWSVEVRSPDGKMIAHARTVEPSGIGTGEIGTFVDLNWTSGSQSPTVVLAFSDGAGQPGGDKSVGINWLSPTHLELTYKGQRTIDFEAVKCYGVDISVRNLSSGTTNASQ
jgi:hypothetical protein